MPVIVIEKNAKKNTTKYIPDTAEQISLEDFGLNEGVTHKEKKAIPKSTKQQIQNYIDNENLKKKERTILELFLKASSYTDSEIQEICSSEGIRFISKSVMKFMEEFIKKLNNEGYDWIGFKVIGMSTYEYYLK